MTQKLNGKVALITGGTSGIGLATAKKYVREGARVIVTGSSEQSVEKARKALHEDVLVLRSDAADLDAVARLLSETTERFGKIDVLFLNAGIFRAAPVLETTIEDFDDQFAVNFKGPYFTLQQAIPHLNEGASVIFNTSVLNRLGMPGTSAYAASKAALSALVHVASVELAARGIRVNAIAPGPIDTPIYGKTNLSDEEVQGLASGIGGRVPMQRFGNADEIASAALFLASDDSSFVVGEEITIDGGFGYS